ncbi:unnamed protein product, partial [Symbiodinium sp. CCMP2456]
MSLSLTFLTQSLSARARPGGAGSPPSRAVPAPSKSEAVARTTPGLEASIATTLDHPRGLRSSSSPKYDPAVRSTVGSASKSEAPRDGKAHARSEDVAVVSTREHPRADRPRSPGDKAGGAGPIPSPDIMAKASRARSPLYVAPAKPKGQRARSPKAKMDPTAASAPSTLGIAPSRGGPTGRTPVTQSHHGTAEEWVESAHFPTKHTKPTAAPPKPFVRARAPSDSSSSENADAKQPIAFAAPPGTLKREPLPMSGRDSHGMLGPPHGRQPSAAQGAAIAVQSVAVSAAGQPAQLRVSLDSGWESLTASPEDLQELTQGETPQVLWVRSDNEIEND